MRCTLQFSWGAHLFFCLSLLWHFGEARVHTEAQAGPLYRVVGSPLFISCSVSGFASASIDKDFEFRIFKPANPSFEINIISTNDPGFGYAIYQSRVRSKDITVNRTSPNSVVFEIQNLEKNDEGDYECTAVNHEVTYDGTYSVTTTVKVIDNSLSVSSSGSASLNYDEGDALTLTCQVSSNTIQHTHLSVTWYLLKGNEDSVQPIISLDKDFTLSPGLGFEGRYQAGLIMLDKVGEATYKLKMVQVELSDQGRIYCEADEWIQDPDRSWYSIARKDAGKTTKVVSLEGGLSIPIMPYRLSLWTCSVSVHIVEVFFSFMGFIYPSTQEFNDVAVYRSPAYIVDGAPLIPQSKIHSVARQH